jgi:ribosome-associated protein
MLKITDQISVDDRELEERFVRASGPGGQNVNKVSTAVELRFDVERSASLPEGVRVRLRRLAGRRLSDEGILVMRADRFRTQERNREDARERLAELIRQATIAPKRRVPTRPSRASKERRRDDKKKRGSVKRLRGSRDLD